MRKSPLDALLTRTCQGILAETLSSESGRAVYLSDLARRLRVPPSSLQRELRSLVSAEILVSRRDGNRVYFQANSACPFLPELRGLVAKTVGIAVVLQQALGSLAGRITVAFIHGSVAESTERSASDVDLLIVGNVGMRAVSSALEDSQETLQRPVNPTVFTVDELRAAVHAKKHFLTAVLGKPKLFVVGSERELEEALGERTG
jgi:DNA-binding transcriptional ArsR family regulator